MVASKAGRPLSADPPDFRTLTARVDAQLMLHGVRVSAHDLDSTLHFAEHAEGADLELSARTMPKIEVGGAAFGFVPTGLVDWLIPGDLAGLTSRFYRALIQGNGGRGLSASASFNHDPSSALTTLEATAGAELLDNGLLRFALRAMSERVLPGPDEERELRRLALAYRDAFDSDLERFARFGAAE